ncbi:unnamed protein product [Nezara viridula]|uniref:Uncharacterized protein n=1 Tax=Nezara viridula TaxID=85310 RepID=A0A9P0ECJ6_NEZVI|nr:unnamed protein product [Nezara viridula]
MLLIFRKRLAVLGINQLGTFIFSKNNLSTMLKILGFMTTSQCSKTSLKGKN